MDDDDYSFGHSFSSASEYFPRTGNHRISDPHEDDEDEIEHGLRGASDEDDTLQLPSASSIRRMHTISSSSSLSLTTPEDRLEALQRTDAELAKKLRDNGRELENRLSDHEAEIDEMQTKIDELKSELQSSKREEKELKAKAVRGDLARALSSILILLFLAHDYVTTHNGLSYN